MKKELQDILSRGDHTLLSQTATWAEIRTICDDGVKYGCASVCIPASYVRRAAVIGVLGIKAQCLKNSGMKCSYMSECPI